MISSLHRRLKRHQTARFSINGIAMSTLDFLLFTIVGAVSSFMPVVINLFSTGITSLLSYRINKHWVFRREETVSHNKRNLTKFIVVTLIGLVVIQNAIIFFVTHRAWGFGQVVRDLISNAGLGDFSTGLVLLASAKLIALIASSVWNFLLYKYAVFPKNSDKSRAD